MVNNYKFRQYFRLVVIAYALALLTSFKNNYTTEKTEPAFLAYYHFFHIRDTTNTGRIWEEEFILASNGNKSAYLSYSKIKQDSLIQLRLQKNSGADGNPIDMGTIARTTSERIYTDQSKKELVLQKSIEKEVYLIKSSLPSITWKIEGETKQLLGYTCQKATGKCMGRVYTAWFTTDIPEGTGPWKLQGLPGLILEAYDVYHRIKFTCTKIQLKTALPRYASVIPPLEAIVTTQKAYDRMDKAYRDGISGDVSSIDGTMVDKVTVNGGVNNGRTKKFSINNPIELVQ
ncbi:GLPGLI family protein [Pedobacter aquatilis]|uniref:GLPGLI family protein n=1 Tax=Pedobacter aquatilis TaxID=351343 RepID=UPI00293140E7|nr:GLPGLI family protein [Pedobacter aquatilis]